MSNLVIVESPTKARTLSQFLGSKFPVTASMGHIRDLPKGEFGVDVDHGFVPKYVIPRDKRKIANQLIKMMADTTHLYLATDPDREGEAIAWHLVELAKTAKNAKLPVKIDRVIFHEITKEAVKEAFDRPLNINNNLVDAQQGRRVLDRLVGYKLSPLLWQKIKRGLSAGRVQSVALRLIVEREREIEKFKPQEYWSVEAELQTTQNSEPKTKNSFIAHLVEKDRKKISPKSKNDTDLILKDLNNAKYKVSKITDKEIKRYPYPPFTTSTLQQTAANMYGYTAKKTMMLAQGLYEHGQITYMRTDSVNLSDSAISASRDYIKDKFGNAYLPEAPKRYKIKSKVAQEAHEAIRPTNITKEKIEMTGQLGKDHAKLYELIWKRMLACQIKEALFDSQTVDVQAASGKQEMTSYLFRATGSIVKFDGWLKIYKQDKASDEEKVLPKLSENEDLKLINLLPEQHFTQPPDRYTDATLVKALEANDIGRPSTYAPIISTLIERYYVERIERKFQPTPIGITVSDFLVENFSNIVDLSFTADMEEGLDGVARGEREWQPMISEFYLPFEKQVEKVTEAAAKIKLEPEKTDQICEKCGRPMVIRYGRFGKFLACSGFPECKNTKMLADKVKTPCPKCGSEIVARRTKRGRTFYGCSQYPKCDFASWTNPDQKKLQKDS